MTVFSGGDTGDLLIPQKMVDPRSLVPDPMNPRVHQTERMKQGVKNWREAKVTRTGQYKGSITVNTRTGRLVTGHGTVEALIADGVDQVQVGYIDVDEDTAHELMLWDNWSSDSATNDDRSLAEVLAKLQEGPGLERTGFSGEDLDSLVALLEVHPFTDDSDDQGILDETDRARWPEVRCQLAPELYERFLAAGGVEDSEKISWLVDKADL